MDKFHASLASVHSDPCVGSMTVSCQEYEAITRLECYIRKLTAGRTKYKNDVVRGLLEDIRASRSLASLV